MEEGYIKYYRKSIKNPLFQKPLIWHYWDYCLMKANFKDKTIIWNQKEMIVERGSFITGRSKAAIETGLSEQTIRTAQVTLINLNMIEKSTSKSTSKFSYLSICNYEEYQMIFGEANQEINQQSTSNQPAINQQSTTTNNVNNVNNDNKEKENITPPIIPKEISQAEAEEKAKEEKRAEKAKEKKAEAARAEEEIQETIKTIIKHFCKVTGFKLNPETAATQKLIRARLKDKGRTLEDFIHVIDVKTRQLLGTKYQVGLTVKNLFEESSFENSLNQPVEAPKEANQNSNQDQRKGDALDEYYQKKDALNELKIINPEGGNYAN
jgi:uncharacterized phage protein (TIGR02220 family)